MARGKGAESGWGARIDFYGQIYAAITNHLGPLLTGPHHLDTSADCRMRMCVCVGQINISLDLGNFMRLGYSNMQSSCAAIWRLYGQRFNREIFRPTEKSKLICHLPLKSFLPVAAIETAAGIAVAISSVFIPPRQRMQIAVPSILSLTPPPARHSSPLGP